ncbi:beta-ketoacyl synthase chain length factor [Niabella insulamsoli]|uniref:beta-ketoacyl synthase chain length factor n=1 Tax=Niabella insulamsoli TaxID=3144874 RepID=UPI0031FDA948
MPETSIYILSASAVSPQSSFEAMLAAPQVYSGVRFACVEPDYAKYVDPKLIRRMSRIIKMGVAAASEALQQASIDMPDAIITGTAYGCLADTDQFLSRMVEFKETLLSPTAFIQSTHNTVAAQIALMLKCHHYNNTYVHRGSSFEAALTDAASLLTSGEAGNVLVGAADELTEHSFKILNRFGLYKKDGLSSSLIKSSTKGTMAGEGAAFFSIANEKKNALAQLCAFKTGYKTIDATSFIDGFLDENDLNLSDIDLIITGQNGDISEEAHYQQLMASRFEDKKTAAYKQFCGEYPTSTAFAFWMAAHILKNGTYQDQPVKRILIYNNYLLQYPSLYCLSAC